MTTLDDLKVQRSGVQREFSKCVNRIERGFDSLSVDALESGQNTEGAYIISRGVLECDRLCTVLGLFSTSSCSLRI